MAGKTVSTREFQQACLSLIDEVGRTHQSVTIVDQGKAIARLVPLDADGRVAVDQARKVVIGGMKGSILRYDEPFAPAADPADWDAVK